MYMWTTLFIVGNAHGLAPTPVRGNTLPYVNISGTGLTNTQITGRVSKVQGPINAVVIYKVVPIKKFYAKFKGVMSAILAAPGLVKEQIPVMLYDVPGNMNLGRMINEWQGASGKSKAAPKAASKAKAKPTPKKAKPVPKPVQKNPDYHHLAAAPGDKLMAEIRQYLTDGTVSEDATPGTTLIVTRNVAALPESCKAFSRRSGPFCHLTIPPGIFTDRGHQFGTELYKAVTKLDCNAVVFKGGLTHDELNNNHVLRNLAGAVMNGVMRGVNGVRGIWKLPVELYWPSKSEADTKRYLYYFERACDNAVKIHREDKQRAERERAEKERQDREREKKERRLQEEKENEEKLVATLPDPTTIQWTHGGEDVRLAGGFNQWSPEGLAMEREEGGYNWSVSVPLPPGRHLYKYIVDTVWRHAPDQLTVTDDDGNVNNYVDVQAGQPVSERQVLAETIDSIVIVLLGATYHFPQTEAEDIACKIVDMAFDLPISELRALSSDSGLIVQHIEAGLRELHITPPSANQDTTPKARVETDGAFSLFGGQSVCVSRGDAQYALVQLMHCKTPPSCTSVLVVRDVGQISIEQDSSLRVRSGNALDLLDADPASGPKCHIAYISGGELTKDNLCRYSRALEDVSVLVAPMTVQTRIARVLSRARLDNFQLVLTGDDARLADPTEVSGALSAWLSALPIKYVSGALSAWLSALHLAEGATQAEVDMPLPAQSHITLPEEPVLIHGLPAVPFIIDDPTDIDPEELCTDVQSITDSLPRERVSGFEVVSHTSTTALTDALNTGKAVLVEQGDNPGTIAKCLYQRYQESKGFGSATVVFLGGRQNAKAPAGKVTRSERGGRVSRGGRPLPNGQGPAPAFRQVVEEFTRESGMPVRDLHHSPGPLLLGDPSVKPGKDFRTQPQDVTVVVLELEAFQDMSTKKLNSMLYHMREIVHTGQPVQMVLIGPEHPRERTARSQLYKKIVVPVFKPCASLSKLLNAKYLPRKRHIERCLELLGNRALDGDFLDDFMEALMDTDKVVSCGSAVTENTLYSLIMSLADPATEVTPDHPPVLVVACNSDIHTIVHALSSACCVVGLALSRAIPGTTVKRHADIMVCDINDIDTCLREGVFATDALEEIVCIGKYATQLWESLSDEVAQALDVNSPRVLTHSGKNVSVQQAPRGYSEPRREDSTPKVEQRSVTAAVATPAKETDEGVVAKTPSAPLPVPAALPLSETVAVLASLPPPSALPLPVQTEPLPLPISATEVSASTPIRDYVPTPLVIAPVGVPDTLPTSIPLPGVSEVKTAAEVVVDPEATEDVSDVANTAALSTITDTETEVKVETETAVEVPHIASTLNTVSETKEEVETKTATLSQEEVE
ncbi:hypothetical protein KIPB_002352 [Kipferlia bialata]|uniref:AMP-activated protein kinase glycogen-binding domain-containing protein n=1 Tax=Kipferlia bialata TaxID=797122 RepID=A0A9K3CQH4_9EUKA|nr:hypothetical protein KIPB_002352 [Kipferlia bialata]|eukprot:g2352.t1